MPALPAVYRSVRYNNLRVHILLLCVAREATVTDGSVMTCGMKMSSNVQLTTSCLLVKSHGYK